MEKDIILLATTITHAGNFATDAQRVNVALTRAKHHLLVLGCSHVLRNSSPAFRLLLASCQQLPPGAHLPSFNHTPPGSNLPPTSGVPSSSAAALGASLPSLGDVPAGASLPSGGATVCGAQDSCGNTSPAGGHLPKAGDCVLGASVTCASEVRYTTSPPTGQAAPGAGSLPPTNIGLRLVAEHIAGNRLQHSSAGTENAGVMGQRPECMKGREGTQAGADQQPQTVATDEQMPDDEPSHEFFIDI